MNLTETPEFMTWPATHYAYIEKHGPFQIAAPQAWQELHAHLANNTLVPVSFFSQYKMEPELIYRAGVGLAQKPGLLPDGVQHTYFQGGRYAQFVLRGSYFNLPAACARVFEIVAEQNLPRRPDFYLEYYLTDPRTTPEEDLVTHILIPVGD